jgi:hypothetical protein
LEWGVKMTESTSEKHLKEALKCLKEVGKYDLEGMSSKDKSLFIQELRKMESLLKKFEAKIG